MNNTAWQNSYILHGSFKDMVGKDFKSLAKSSKVVSKQALLFSIAMAYFWLQGLGTQMVFPNGFCCSC